MQSKFLCRKAPPLHTIQTKKNSFSQAFPEVAGELFKREHTFRNYVNSLDQTVTHYNRLKGRDHPRMTSAKGVGAKADIAKGGCVNPTLRGMYM